MSNEVQEVSIGQLFGVFKKNLIKGLVFVLIGVIIITSIMLCVSAFTSVNVYSSTVTYKEASSGAASYMNSQKSNVMNKALEKVYPNDPEKVLKLSTELTSELSISAIVPTTIKTTDEYVPTSFSITLKPVKSLKLSTTEYKNILDAASQQFAETLESNTFEKISFSVNVEEALKISEYIQVADLIADKAQESNSMINTFNGNTKTGEEFKSSKNITTSDLVNKLSVLQGELTRLKHNIAKTKTEITNNGIKNYLTLTLDATTAEETKFDELLTITKDAYDKYNTTVKAIVQEQTGEKTIVFTGDDYYDKLTGQMLYYSKSKNAQTAKKIEIQNLIDEVDAHPLSPDPDGIKNSLIKYSADLEAIAKQYNEFVEEYGEYRTENSSAYITSPAKSKVETSISTKVIILANVAAIVILYLVSYGLTYSKLKKQGYFKGEMTEEEKIKS